MKKFITLLCAMLAFSAAGLKAEEADNSVAVLSKQYSLKDFQALSASNSFKVTLVQDNQWSVDVEYSDFLEPYLDVAVNAGTLRLGIRDLPRSVQNSRKYKDGAVLRATVHMPRLTRLSLSGASKCLLEGRFTLSNEEEFRLDLSGASVAENVAVDAHKARLVMSGASKCNSFEGSFYQVRMNLAGASKGTFDIAAEDWDVVLSGSAHADLRGPECRTMDIESSGASKADVTVSSDSLQYEGSGSSDLYAMDAPTRKAKIELSGASSCRVAVKESIEVEASGASTCRYKAVDDAPLKTRFNTSRGSRIVSQ
jgi:hypothetical protein